VALKITDECICCDACVSPCPTQAISCDDPIYIIEFSKCTECRGYFKLPQCIEVCPVDAIVKDEENFETKQELAQKYKMSKNG